MTVSPLSIRCIITLIIFNLRQSLSSMVHVGNQQAHLLSVNRASLSDNHSNVFVCIFLADPPRAVKWTGLHHQVHTKPVQSALCARARE